MTRICMKAVYRNIWRYSVSLQTKTRVYNVHNTPATPESCKVQTGGVVVYSQSRVNAFISVSLL